MAPLTAADIAGFASTITVPVGWRLLDDVELMDLPDPAFVIDGILMRHGLGVLYGPSGSCKTTLVASLLLSIASGRSWFGHTVCHRGNCAYVATEDPRGFKVRMKAAKVAAGFSLSHAVGVYTFPEPIDLRDDVSINGFVRFMRDTDLRFEQTVIDTYASATPGASENSSEDTTLAMSAAAKIQTDLGCGVLLVHHTNAGGSRERGHSSMRGAADSMLSVTPVDDVIHLESSKQRNGGPFEPMMLKLSPVPETGGVVLRLASDVLPSSGLTALQDKALSVLRDTFASNGATKSEWRSSCQDVPERSFHRAAKVLQERGFVRAVGSHFVVVGARS